MNGFRAPSPPKLACFFQHEWQVTNEAITLNENKKKKRIAKYSMAELWHVLLPRRLERHFIMRLPLGHVRTHPRNR